MAVAVLRFVSLRLALFYVTYFGVVGIWLPFWPAWLGGLGLTDREIGVLMGLGSLVRVLANPLVAQSADRRGERRHYILALAWAGASVFALYLCGTSFAWLLAVSLAFGVLFAPMLALGESLTMLASAAHGISYGRVRLWGSLAFIVASVGSGELLEAAGSTACVPWLMLGVLATHAVLCHGLPDVKPDAPEPGPRRPLSEVLGQGWFWLFLSATALTQASHAVYYCFGTLGWQAAGHGERVIGVLWAEGVVAEIALFALAPQLSRRLGAPAMIALGAGAAVVRWTVLAETTALPVLLLVQPLHALTFGATHLGAMRVISEQVPPRASATAQALYAGVATGGAMGLAMWASGPLRGAVGDAAYLAMAAMGGTGALLALALLARLRRRR